MVTKTKLVALAQQRGLCFGQTGGNLDDCIGNIFERFVLKSFKLRPNKKPFTPKIWTYGIRQSVVPDAVFPTAKVSATPSFYAESGFLEVKAVAPGVLVPSSFTYQLSAMIDALADSAAVKAGSPGQLILITTAGVSIGRDLILDATVRDVALWHGIALEPPQKKPGSLLLQVGVTKLLNVEAYRAGGPAATILPPKPPTELL